MKNRLQNSFNKKARILLIVIGLVFAGPVMSADDYFTESDIYLQPDNRTSDWQRMCSTKTTHNFGVLENLWITNIHGWIHQVKDDLDGTNEIYYSTYNVSTASFITDWYTSGAGSMNWVDWSGGTRDISFSRENINNFNVAASTPGNYQFQAKVRTHYTNTSDYLYHPTSTNYVVSYIIAGFNGYSSSKTFSDVVVNTYSESTISFSHFGDTSFSSSTGTATISNVSGTSGTFSVRSFNNTGVTVRYTASAGTIGTTTAKLTLTDSYGKTAIINLSGTTVTDLPTTVNIANEPVLSNGPQVELSGYLKYTGCKTIKKYGFVLCLGGSCNPSASRPLWVETEQSTAMKQKTPFSMSFYKMYNNAAGTSTTPLVAGNTYTYKAYVKDTEGNYYYSDAKTFTAGSACTFAVGDTIYYTIDNTQAEDPCLLRFNSLANAIADMKQTTTGHAAWINANNIVQKPIVMEVVASTTAYGNSDNSTRITNLESINTTSVNNSTYDPTPSSPGERLIVRAQDPSKKPTFKGGMSLLKARNVTLKNIKITRITSTSDHTGSAVELGHYPGTSSTDDSNANNCVPGNFANTNIELLGCEIEATGFNCVHAAGCNGLKFDDCVFNLTGSGDGDNDKYWGASVKMMSCKNVQFTRNNMRGSHATTLFLQHTQNMLIMNNVFWNDNLFDSNVAFVRPVVMNVTGVTKRDIQNIGIYYNTFYLENRSTSSSSEKIDFLRFGCTDDVYGSTAGAQRGTPDNYKDAYIHFKWNNCYSYDGSINQCNANVSYTTAFQKSSLTDGNFAYNNFWGKADAEPKNEESNSNLRFGTNTKHIDVEDQVCKSTATDPDELILKGSLLNIGAKPASDISGLNIANHTFADRFNSTIRSEGNDWTYGAFQQANIVEVDTIIWVGGRSNAWDVRSNWATTTGKRLNCANMFAANLHVIIPDAENLKNVPVIPDWASGSRGTYSEEYVAAGLGAKSYENVSKFATSFSIEEGGAVIGIENLYGDGTLRYNSAANSYTAVRKQWVLVGGVIKPFVKGSVTEVRNVASGDFYIADHLPHVYMQHFERKSGTNNIVPGTPFTSLEEEVTADKAFGIYIPDQYGPYKLPAQIYYEYYEKNDSKKGDADVAKTFDFEGRFANETALPSYNIAATDTWYFVNNSYPANLNVAKLLYDNSGMGLQAYVYNYTQKSWSPVDDSNEPANAVYVKPNNGFVLYATTSTGTVTTTQDEYGTGSTNYLKSASADSYLKLLVTNTADATASTVSIRYGASNLYKAFSYNASTPEIYIPGANGEMYSRLGIDEDTKVIPLSVRNKQTSGNQTVQFSLSNHEGFDMIVLEDRLQNKEYDLLGGEEAYFSGIAPGDCEGRFYLKLAYVDDSSITTATEEVSNSDAEGEIGIYASGDELTVSAPASMILERIIVTDMSGRSFEVEPMSPNFSRHRLVVNSGVYVVKAICDKASKTEKVIIK